MKRRFLMAVFATWLGACAGDGGPPRLDTGLPRDVPADEVTPDEARLACQRYEDLANEALGAEAQQQLTCTLLGIASQLSGGTSCRTSVASCLATPPAAQSLDFDCELAITFAPSGCTATIGELEDCVNAVSADIDAVTSQVSCSLATDLEGLVEAALRASTIAAPASNSECVGLAPECIALLGWTSDVTPTFPTP